MKKRYVLTFPSDTTNEPITYNLVKQFDIKINIIKAKINAGEEGTLLLEMDAAQENIRKARKYLEENHIACQSVEKKVHWKEDECMHCGACTAVCFSQALTMDANRQLIFNTEKCIVCELCVKACPLKLFEIHFSE
ncbi:MAG: 4Fe-4S binding protein [Candidatus Marinimicrobia bacterium]|nr:4Fe-4S binding protein [Candidatus Neomarinimicrobiota bacterium]